MHIGLIGFGSIGRGVYERLRQNPEFRVSALVRSDPKISAGGPDLFFDYERFIQSGPDLVVECAGHNAVKAFGAKVLDAGCSIVIASVGALADRGLEAELNAAAEQSRSRLLLPCGAIGGLDILRAIAREGEVELRYRGIKPPNAWKGSAAQELIDLDSLNAATVFFSANARETALQFPKNANVVAALALAGGGWERMHAELVADPVALGNSHSYHVTSQICNYEMRIQSLPNASNARTSQTTVLSIVDQIFQFA